MNFNPKAMQYGLSVFGLIWYLGLWTIGLLGCFAARRRYRSRTTPRTTLQSPGVSILRPLKGLDSNLYENLESTFKQDYPTFEILFSVADENDEALTVVQALVDRYPHVKATIVIGEEVVGVNPKVNNLIRPFRQAAHDILWVLDSGVLVDPGTLARSVDALTVSSHSQKTIGLVHHLPVAQIKETRLGSRLEAAFLNTNHAKMYIAINTLAVDSCVVGKSNLYRRSDVEKVNGSLIPVRKQVLQRESQQSKVYGLAAFGKYLAEDNMIAGAIWHELGLRHDLSCDVAKNIVGDMSFWDYVWRRVRWIRVRKRMVLAATLVEPFTESIVVSLIGGYSCGQLFGIPLWLFLPMHFVPWLFLDLDVYQSIAGNSPRGGELGTFLLAWCAREVLALPIWILAILGSEVAWRGRSYKVLRNGEASLSVYQGSSSGWRHFWRRTEPVYHQL
ncbi:glycosyltransferase family 21 protein [Crepidotus variabilis]|uniref:Ceramide glucosyltransferase n=1 Tax=Crepidotus variabilis TaxID=179855 RepID=A0A9P6EF76_9AGAR|nr:glycosyltransferase family 21 protein [Crepidotus variabilis]